MLFERIYSDVTWCFSVYRSQQTEDHFPSLPPRLECLGATGTQPAPATPS